MKHSAVMICAGALLIGGAAGGYFGARATQRAARTASATATASAVTNETRADLSVAGASIGLPPAEPLAWSELLEAGATLAPSAKAKGLSGQRVRLVGFMAELELPIPGAFYLVPRPIDCDEAGGGTADLMPASVLVISESTQGQIVPHLPGALDVSGVLEVGNQPGPDGRMSAFRLRLDHGVASGSGEPERPGAPDDSSG